MGFPGISVLFFPPIFTRFGLSCSRGFTWAQGSRVFLKCSIVNFKKITNPLNFQLKFENKSIFVAVLIDLKIHKTINDENYLSIVVIYKTMLLVAVD